MSEPRIEEAAYLSAIKELERLNESEGVDFRGKNYTMVSNRIVVFRKYYPHLSINTILIEAGKSTGDVIVFRAVICDEDGGIKASGHAVEIIGAGSINKSSALENCETSAIGRALACFGLHGGEFASANEINSIDRKDMAVDSVRVSNQQRPPASGHSQRIEPKPPRAPEKKSAFIMTEEDVEDFLSEVKGFADHISDIEKFDSFGSENIQKFKEVRRQLGSIDDEGVSEETGYDKMIKRMKQVRSEINGEKPDETGDK